MMNYMFLDEQLYSFVSVGLRKNKSKLFSSREAAKKYMYKLCAKNNLVINEIWDDKHNKTYNCNNGVSFYIQRAA